MVTALDLSMKRRQALSLCGISVIGFISGCLTSSSNDDTTEGNNNDASDGESTDSEEAPGEDTGTENDLELDRFKTETADFLDEYPSLGRESINLHRLIPYEYVDVNDTPAYLKPSDEDHHEHDEISFSLTNETGKTFLSSFYGWELYKFENGRWFDVKLSDSQDPLQHLGSDQRHEWTVIPTDVPSIIPEWDEDEEAKPGEWADSLGNFDSKLYVPGLGSGEYAFGITGWFEGEEEKRTGFVTTFDLDLESPPLEPTEAVQIVSHEENSVRAETIAREDVEYDEPRSFTLERTSEAEAGTQIIREQAWRYPPLWDLLALSETYDAEIVELEEYDQLRHTISFQYLDVLGGESKSTLEFEGDYFAISPS